MTCGTLVPKMSLDSEILGQLQVIATFLSVKNKNIFRSVLETLLLDLNLEGVKTLVPLKTPVWKPTCQLCHCFITSCDQCQVCFWTFVFSKLQVSLSSAFCYHSMVLGTTFLQDSHLEGKRACKGLPRVERDR